MHEISQRILHYKRKDIQKLMVESAKGREVGTRFGSKGFGKRPDVLIYENDILEGVKKGVTSFHISEERWFNPLELETGLNKKQLDELRQGWDLVLDIDCPYWFYSKLTTHLFIQALKEHNIFSISCKFSGNKGFHIGVPFEAFPESVNNIPAKDWFPEGPKKIALYLLEFIAKNLIHVDTNETINFGGIHKITKKKLAVDLQKTEKELSKTICENCNNLLKETTKKIKTEFVCSKCEKREFKDNDTKLLVCNKCSILMNKIEHNSSICKCGSNNYAEVFDPLSIVEIDTILISSRHMYRAPYSLHEKSGLVSLPISPEEVMSFEKESAATFNITQTNLRSFLNSKNTHKDEAKSLFTNAVDSGKEDLMYESIIQSKEPGKKIEFEEITDAIPVEYFPPCILKILEGIEDGKKRSLFLLTNFLTSVGWSHNQTQDILLKWNQKNNPVMQTQSIKNQVGYHKRKKEKILPPNCRSYYQDFQMCNPDNLCERIKNPVQYTKKKSGYTKKTSNYTRLTDEQKEMRRKYRQRLKSQKTSNIKKENIET